MSRTPQEELVHFLSDLYSVELQALAQMASAPGIADDPALAADFRTHHTETEEQAEMVRARLEALGGTPSTVKDAIMKIGGKGFLLFAKAMPETPGRLVAHSYSYEAMEWAGYEVLIRMAEQLGDSTTAAVGRTIQAQERTMMRRMEERYDAAEAASHRQVDAGDVSTHVGKHLAEAHALESQSLKLMEKGVKIAGDAQLSQIYAQHREETLAQIDSLEQRIRAIGASTSKLEDAALKLGALNWGLFFQAQADTPAKLAAFAYAVEHLEIAGYELLLRTARRANDPETVRLCERILTEERAMTERLAESIGHSVRVSFAKVSD